MTQNTKRIGLLFFAISLVTVILLSSSLSNLRLQAGMPFPGGGNSNVTSESVPSPASEANFSSMLWKGIIDLILIVLLISIPVRLIPFINLKRLSQVLLVVIVLLLIANLISLFPGSQPVHLPGEPSGIATTQPSFDYPVSPLGEPPNQIVWFVIIGVVFGVGFLALKLWKQEQSPIRFEDQLSQEAESAVQAIKVGEGLRSAILRCYLQMARALQEEQNIERGENMTVHEFEEWLAQKGFPTVPVHQLTYLFEKVRYGQEEIDKEDETTAVESLNEIIKFCRTQREPIR